MREEWKTQFFPKRTYNHRASDRIATYIKIVEAVLSNHNKAKVRMSITAKLNDSDFIKKSDYLVTVGFLRETPLLTGDRSSGKRQTYAVTAYGIEWLKLAKVVLAAIPYRTENEIQELKMSCH